MTSDLSSDRGGTDNSDVTGQRRRRGGYSGSPTPQATTKPLLTWNTGEAGAPADAGGHPRSLTRHARRPERHAADLRKHLAVHRTDHAQRDQDVFVVAKKARLNTRVTVQHRSAKSSPSLSQGQRLAWIHELLTGASELLPYRVAGMLLLLYAQPLVKSSRSRPESSTTATPVCSPAPSPAASCIPTPSWTASATLASTSSAPATEPSVSSSWTTPALARRRGPRLQQAGGIPPRRQGG